MMQLTGQNRFTRSLSGGYEMTNGSRVRKLFFILIMLLIYAGPLSCHLGLHVIRESD